jgi:hypothetical protein
MVYRRMVKTEGSSVLTYAAMASGLSARAFFM